MAKVEFQLKNGVGKVLLNGVVVPDVTSFSMMSDPQGGSSVNLNVIASEVTGEIEDVDVFVLVYPEASE